MSEQGFALFGTAIGRCGIAWGPRGLIGVQLPEASDDAALRRLVKRFPQAEETAPPREVARTIAAIQALLDGGDTDLSEVALDMDRVPAFNKKVYAIARSVRPGATLSYGAIAEALGDTLLARDVGQAMAQNPFPIVVPCHRVLAAGGKIGGFSAEGGIETKRRMLAIESAHAKGEADAPGLFDGM